MRKLAGGFSLAEAPRPAGDGTVYFSDVVAGGVFRLDSTGQVECVIPDRRRVGGIALHADGGIVITGRSVVHAARGTMRQLLAIDGVIFNDLCCDEAGRVWVGGIRFNQPTSDNARPGAIFRINDECEAIEVSAAFGIPNGMGFSPDGTVLYVADSATRLVEALPLDSEGRVVDRRTIADLTQGQGPHFGYPSPLPTPDGLAVDEAGGVWVAIAGGGSVHRYTPDGALDYQIDVPSGRPTSVAFGGDDGKDMYITTAIGGDGEDGGVFLARCEIAGLTMPPSRV